MRLTANHRMATILLPIMLAASLMACNFTGRGPQQPTPTLYVIPTPPPTSTPPSAEDTDGGDDSPAPTVTAVPTDTPAPTLDLATPTPLADESAPVEEEGHPELEATAAALEAMLDDLFNQNQGSDSLDDLDEELNP